MVYYRYRGYIRYIRVDQDRLRRQTATERPTFAGDLNPLICGIGRCHRGVVRAFAIDGRVRLSAVEIIADDISEISDIFEGGLGR